MKRDVEVWNAACCAWYDKGVEPSMPHDRAARVIAAYRKEIERKTVLKVVRWLERLENAGRLRLKHKGGFAYEDIPSPDPNWPHPSLRWAPSVSVAVRWEFLERRGRPHARRLLSSKPRVALRRSS